jgi:formylglycine-generating enzyme required for sulfatase activity
MGGGMLANFKKQNARHIPCVIRRYAILLTQMLSWTVSFSENAGSLAAVRAAGPLTIAEERSLKPMDSFKECDVCPEMVVVPAGSFMMGSPPDVEGRFEREGPQHPATISRPFAVGRYEVSFVEWDACVEDNRACGYRPTDYGWGRGKRPVIYVSWNEIQSYLKWLNGKIGRTRAYRLPTEAEWEYAARAGTTTPFWWGRTISTDQANYYGLETYGGGSKGEYRAKTVPVDSFAPNPWGLYNVHGNVWEWVQDCWHPDFKNAPSDGSEWTQKECRSRVQRGGSWLNDPRFLRSASRRQRWAVLHRHTDGFRVVRSLITQADSEGIRPF